MARRQSPAGRRPWEDSLGRRGLRVFVRRLWRRLERTHSGLGLEPGLGSDQQSPVWWLVRFDDVVILREREREPAQAFAYLKELERDAARLATLLEAGLGRRLLHGPLRRGWLVDYLPKLEARFVIERRAFAAIAPHLLEPEPVKVVGGRRSRRSPLAERAAAR